MYYNTNNHLEWCRKSNQRGFSEIYISRFKVGNGRILVRNMRKTGRVQCLGWLVTRPPGEKAARAQDEDVGSAQDSMSGSGWFELATT